MYAGVIGRSLKSAPGPVQTDSFDRMQRFIGQLELASCAEYPAMHAAYHAFLNGVDRVIFCGVEEPERVESWTAALERLFKSDPLPVVVAPGGPSGALAEAFRALPFTRAAFLWVDRVAGERYDNVRAASQSVPTVSPGRRSFEELRATALIAPLHLETTRALKGRHERPTEPGLLTTDARGRIVLDGHLSPPGTTLPPRPMSEVTSVQFRIDRAVAAMAEPILLRENTNPALYKRLQRETQVILQGFLRRGEITAFTVRCDAETSAEAPGPVVEVMIREPRRVDAVVLRFQQF